MAREYTRRNPVERFWEKVMPEPNTGCWFWLAAVSSETGYGIYCVATGKRVSAHRHAYTLAHGAIPEDASGKTLHVLHKCDVRLCVNPAHLFLGTNADNVADMDTKGRRRCAPARGIAHHNAKLAPTTVEEARRLWGNRGRTGRSAHGPTLQSLSREYGVAASTLHAAILGKAWNNA